MSKEDIQARLDARISKTQVQACVRGAHVWGPPDHRGWATCKGCGTVSTTPKEAGSGAYDRSSSSPGDM